MLGKMVVAFEGVSYAQFHSRALQLSILVILDKCWKSLYQPIHLTDKTRAALEWWISMQVLDAEKSFLPMTWKVLMTKASLLGWGGGLENLYVQGMWSSEVQKLLINPQYSLEWVTLKVVMAAECNMPFKVWVKQRMLAVAWVQLCEAAFLCLGGRKTAFN